MVCGIYFVLLSLLLLNLFFLLTPLLSNMSHCMIGSRYWLNHLYYCSFNGVVVRIQTISLHPDISLNLKYEKYECSRMLVFLCHTSLTSWVYAVEMASCKFEPFIQYDIFANSVVVLISLGKSFSLLLKLTYLIPVVFRACQYCQILCVIVKI